MGKILKFQVIVIVALILLIIPTAVAAALITDANARVRESWGSLRRVVGTVANRPFTQFKPDDLARLQYSVDDLIKTLDNAKRQTSFLRTLSPFKADVGAALNLMDTGQEVLLAADDMLAGVAPTINFLIQGTGDQAVSAEFSASDRIAELLRVGQGSFTSASQHLATAKDGLQKLKVADLPPELLLVAEELIRYQQQLQDLNETLLEGPDLLNKALGLTDPQDYLVLSENSDELRPSGGYISTWGWVRVRRAHVVDYGYSPTTATSPNPPPDSLVTELKVPDWWIQAQQPIYMAWDGSWYADFPSTAKLSAWFYTKGDNPRSPVGGVIAIDIYGFEEILSGLGSVTVPGYNEVVTPDNFRDVIYKIREGGGDLPHKRFLAALYNQILSDWQKASQKNGTGLFNSLLRSLQDKHIMLYFADENLNRAVHALGWDGAQLPGPGHDYLMVADANMGNKSNRSITRQLTYDVEILPDGTLKSRASIAYDYSALAAEKDPGVNSKNYNDINYHNIMQVFVPASSVLTDQKNLQASVEVVSEKTYTNFVSVTEVKYDRSERFQYLYSTPVLVEKLGPYNRYRLLLQKQAGMAGESVDVTVTLPTGAQVINASPTPDANYTLSQPVLAFHTQLTTDQWIEIIYTN